MSPSDPENAVDAVATSASPSRYTLTTAVFLRLLALVYFAAFVSTGVQILGLAGEQGILPVGTHIAELRAAHGWAGFWQFPTLFWLNASDQALYGASLAGCLFSVTLFFNWLPRVSLALLFVLYLSLFHAGQLFMNFQWDYLLLESGFLAIFLGDGNRPTVWLLRWLLFRLRFLSGASKLLSHDPTWAGLTALNYFFEVQPLPHWGGWYAHLLPEWMLRFATGATLFIELVVPFMMFMPRRIRFVGGWLTILMQVAILLTTNHNYANVLVLVLCLFLFDDQALSRVVPPKLAERVMRRPLAPALPGFAGGALTGMIAASLLTASGFQMWGMLSGRENPAPVDKALGWLQPFHVVNRYHVFPTMKTERIELVIEASRDGVHWVPWEFKYKPGDPKRRPEVIVPHHPRIDWLMWFVPESPIFLPWFESLLTRLLENSPHVVTLMGPDPFGALPPLELRVSVYRYHFTDAATRAATGAWWTREYLGPFLPLPGLSAERH